MRRLISSLLLLTVVVVSPASARKKQAEAGPSVERGDPPPGAAMQMRPGMARVVLRDELQKRYLASIPNTMLLPGTTYFETRNVRLTRDAVAFEYDELTGKVSKEKKSRTVTLEFNQEGYWGLGQAPAKVGSFYFVAPLGAIGHWKDYWGNALLAWKDERDAQRFADAFNRLIYEAHAKQAEQELPVFASKARAWREQPEARAPAPAGWERHRILAEASVREDVMGALGHYEDGLEVYPMWPEGWFNAALLYEALGEFEYAGNRMRHYLELAPDARDADAAREKLIIWDDKAHRQKESQ